MKKFIITKTSEYSFDVREVTITGYSPVTEKTLLLDGENVLIGADDELFDTKEEALNIILEKYEHLAYYHREILKTVRENYESLRMRLEEKWQIE